MPEPPERPIRLKQQLLGMCLSDRREGMKLTGPNGHGASARCDCTDQSFD